MRYRNAPHARSRITASMQRLFARVHAYLWMQLWARLPARFRAPLCAGILLAIASAPVPAATTDIAQAPIASSGAKPNLMFMLDDSGSMQWSYLGDSVKTNGYVNAVGYRSALCNRLYYDPKISYTPPIAADGTAFPAASFTAAYYDGYDRKAWEAVDLSTGFMAWRSAK